jgi:hypothetical protein
VTFEGDSTFELRRPGRVWGDSIIATGALARHADNCVRRRCVIAAGAALRAAFALTFT